MDDTPGSQSRGFLDYFVNSRSRTSSKPAGPVFQREAFEKFQNELEHAANTPSTTPASAQPSTATPASTSAPRNRVTDYPSVITPARGQDEGEGSHDFPTTPVDSHAHLPGGFPPHFGIPNRFEREQRGIREFQQNRSAQPAMLQNMLKQGKFHFNMKHVNPHEPVHFRENYDLFSESIYSVSPATAALGILACVSEDGLLTHLIIDSHPIAIPLLHKGRSPSAAALVRNLDIEDYEALVHFIRDHSLQQITSEHNDAAALSWFVKQDQDMYKEFNQRIPANSYYSPIVESARQFLVPMTYFLALVYVTLPRAARTTGTEFSTLTVKFQTAVAHLPTTTQTDT